MADECIFVLVVAHPDDESMFFFPTLNLITTLQIENDNSLLPKISNHHSNTTTYSTYVLCLSNGGYDNLGHVREKEMYNVCKKCYSLDPNHVKVVNHEDLQDNPDIHWNEDVISDTVQNYIEDIIKERSKSLSCIPSNYTASTINQPNYQICIFTFDNYGVSGHINHISTSRGVRKFLYKQKPQNYDLKVFELQSIKSNILRKYFFPIDWCYYKCNKSKYERNKHSILVIAFYPWNAWCTMSLHASQFVWYRKLSILFSRYCYVNTFQEVSF